MANILDSKELEGGFWGGILCDPGRCIPIAISNNVAVDWFVNYPWPICWAAVKELWRETMPKNIDALAILQRTRRIAANPESEHFGKEPTMQILGDAIENGAVGSRFEYSMELLRQNVIVRRINAVQARFRQDIEHGRPIEAATIDLQNCMTSIVGEGVAAKTKKTSDILEIVMRDYKEAHRIRIDEKNLEYTPGFPLPWRKLNQLSNGLQEGLYIIGARPSVGKTAFTLNLIRYWCEKGIKIGFNSLDMAIKQLMKRPITELSRVSYNKASFGTTTNDDLKKLEDAKNKIAEWPLNIIEERDVDMLRSWCIAMKAMGKIDIVIVDFLQLMSTKRKYLNDNEKIEYISGTLKSIAVELQMPVIALSQLNRACEENGGRIPTASDLRGSGSLEQDAFAVWILHRDKEVKDLWNKTDSIGNRNHLPTWLTAGKTEDEAECLDPVRLIIVKNQNGQAGQQIWLPFVFYQKYCAFMLGDYQARATATEQGYGATKKLVYDYEDRYKKVYSDWRKDPLENILRERGALIY